MLTEGNTRASVKKDSGKRPNSPPPAPRAIYINESMTLNIYINIINIKKKRH